MKQEALFEGIPIKMVARWGRNGRKYVWLNPTQKQLDDLIYKYGVEQLSSGSIKENGVWQSVECLWLEQ